MPSKKETFGVRLRQRTTFTQTANEELFNTISHGVGVIFGLVATMLFGLQARDGRGGTELASLLVFGISLTVLYLASTLYHAVPAGPAKRVLRRFDHSAIFLLIAGTYTPFGFLAMPRGVGIAILSIEWALALTGIVLAVFFRRHGRSWQQLAFVVLYLFMGWLILPALGDVSRILSTEALRWTIAGGVFYTSGVGFFSLKRLPYAHGVWHLFVLAGSVSHFIAVYGYL